MHGNHFTGLEACQAAVIGTHHSSTLTPTDSPDTHSCEPLIRTNNGRLDTCPATFTSAMGRTANTICSWSLTPPRHAESATVGSSFLKKLATRKLVEISTPISTRLQPLCEPFHEHGDIR